MDQRLHRHCRIFDATNKWKTKVKFYLVETICLLCHFDMYINMQRFAIFSSPLQLIDKSIDIEVILNDHKNSVHVLIERITVKKRLVNVFGHFKKKAGCARNVTVIITCCNVP